MIPLHWQIDTHLAPSPPGMHGTSYGTFMGRLNQLFEMSSSNHDACGLGDGAHSTNPPVGVDIAQIFSISKSEVCWSTIAHKVAMLPYTQWPLLQ